MYTWADRPSMFMSVDLMLALATVVVVVVVVSPVAVVVERA